MEKNIFECLMQCNACNYYTYVSSMLLLVVVFSVGLSINLLACTDLQLQVTALLMVWWLLFEIEGPNEYFVVRFAVDLDICLDDCWVALNYH